MLSPLNVASSIDCASAKSLNQPTFGQIATFAYGTPQNFVNSVSCGHEAQVQLEAELLHLVLEDLGRSSCRDRRCRRWSGPCRRRSTCRWRRSAGSDPAAWPRACTSWPRPDRPWGSPGSRGRRPAWGRRPPRNPAARAAASRWRWRPTTSPPRVRRSASRSERGDDRLADVDVVERLDGGVERDVVHAAGRREERPGPCCASPPA